MHADRRLGARLGELAHGLSRPGQIGGSRT
jgi:hypothetical protein